MGLLDGAARLGLRAAERVAPRATTTARFSPRAAVGVGAGVGLAAGGWELGRGAGDAFHEGGVLGFFTGAGTGPDGANQEDNLAWKVVGAVVIVGALGAAAAGAYVLAKKAGA